MIDVHADKLEIPLVFLYLTLAVRRRCQMNESQNIGLLMKNNPESWALGMQ